MAQALLPVLASAAGTEAVMAKLNQAGAKHRERWLPFVARVVELLDFVPETVALKPAAQAYIDGSDTEHLGDFVAELVKGWSTSASPDAVLQVLQQLPRQAFQKVARRVLWSGAKGCKGWAKGKGKGKGLFACLWPAESSSSAEDSGEKEAKADGEEVHDPVNLDGIQASMAQALLPVLASAAGTEAVMAKLNQAGAKHRERWLPFVARVGELLDFVPETVALKP